MNDKQNGSNRDAELTSKQLSNHACEKHGNVRAAQADVFRDSSQQGLRVHNTFPTSRCRYLLLYGTRHEHVMRTTFSRQC